MKGELDNIILYNRIGEWSYRSFEEGCDVLKTKHILGTFLESFSYMAPETIAFGVQQEDLGIVNPWNKGRINYIEWMDSIPGSIKLEDIAANGSLECEVGLVHEGEVVEKAIIGRAVTFQIWSEVEDVEKYIEFSFKLKLNVFSPEIFMENGRTFKLPNWVINHNKEKLGMSFRKYCKSTDWANISFESGKPYHLKVSINGFED